MLCSRHALCTGSCGGEHAGTNNGLRGGPFVAAVIHIIARLGVAALHMARGVTVHSNISVSPRCAHKDCWVGATRMAGRPPRNRPAPPHTHTKPVPYPPHLPTGHPDSQFHRFSPRGVGGALSHIFTPPRLLENGTPPPLQKGGAKKKGAVLYAGTCFPGAKKPVCESQLRVYDPIVLHTSVTRT